PGRRRRAGPWPGGAGGCASGLGLRVRSLAQSVKDSRQLALELLLCAVVDRDVGGALRLLVLGELARRALADGLVAARAGALGPELLGRDHGDRRIEGAVHVRLEEQRNLDDRGDRRRL